MTDLAYVPGVLFWYLWNIAQGLKEAIEAAGYVWLVVTTVLLIPALVLLMLAMGRVREE